MFIFLIMILLFYQTYCFNSPNIKKPVTNFNFVGDTKPLGFFDPLELTNNINEDLIKFSREAELHHCRIAMVTSLILPVIDLFYSDLGISFFDKLSYGDKMYFILNISFLESRRLILNFEKNLKIKNEPGKYFDFDCNENDMNKELNNGRLAMIGVSGYIIQELITGTKVFS